jgi:hypothetical protein
MVTNQPPVRADVKPNLDEEAPTDEVLLTK